MSISGRPLDSICCDAKLTDDELWVRYVGNGGTATCAQFRSFLHDGSWPGALQYDIAVSALNERFVELDADHTVPYAG